MKDQVRVLDRALAVVQAREVAFDKFKMLPRRLPNQCANLVQVVAMAGREIVKAHDLLALAQEKLHQVGADKAGRSGDQPALGIGLQIRDDSFEDTHG